MIPQDLADAFVAIEDERFYEHNGIDIDPHTGDVYVSLIEGTVFRVCRR